MAVGQRRLCGEQPFLGKVFKKRLRILQVGGIEAFGEPAVHGREQVVGVPPLAPIGPKPGEIAGGSKLEYARRLVTGRRRRARCRERPRRPERHLRREPCGRRGRYSVTRRALQRDEARG